MTVPAHAARREDGRCAVPDEDGWWCGCAPAFPDAGSPCGFEGCLMGSRDCHCDDPAEGCDGDHPLDAAAHPHVPTRCGSCGHPIVEERR